MVNTGKDSLRIVNIQASCGCTTPEWDRDKAIAPGASYQFERLPSQMADPVNQAKLEKLAEQALSKVGLKRQNNAPLGVQVSAVQRQENTFSQNGVGIGWGLGWVFGRFGRQRPVTIRSVRKPDRPREPGLPARRLQRRRVDAYVSLVWTNCLRAGSLDSEYDLGSRRDRIGS